MSHSAGPSEDVVYIPVPKEGEHTFHPSPPASPGPGTPLFRAPIPQDISLNEPSQMSQLPPGAASGTPTARFLGSPIYRDSYASSQGSGYRYDPSEHDSTVDLAGAYNLNKVPSRKLSAKRPYKRAPTQKRSRRTIVILVLLGIILVAAGVVVGVYFGVIRKNNDNSTTGGGSGSPSGSGPNGQTPVAQRIVSGGDGSAITYDDGTTGTYSNAFGGSWYYDEQDPFNNNAQAQSWTTPMNDTFKYGKEPIRGVNLGGWLVPEPFISPALFQKYQKGNNPAIDEWTLSQNMRADKGAGGGIKQMEDHYRTFITEQDFQQIAAAGLNYVRIGLGWWAIEVRGNEPHLEKVSWTYFLKAIKWARKYGLRINLDFHAVPGSQNGWNHSGKFGSINFLYGPMGYANAQRTLDYIRIITEFISQPEYANVVTMFSILNEPQGAQKQNMENVKRFYLEAYKVVRGVTGLGAGKGPIIAFHDAFSGMDGWAHFLPNADRVALDSHPYNAFGENQSTEPPSAWKGRPCGEWGGSFNQSQKDFGLTFAGEWSLATTDCGLYLNNVGWGTRYEGTDPYPSGNAVGNCADVVNWQQWSTATKKDYMSLALHSMDALQNHFFWTWRIGNSTKGYVETPHWSYKLGLEQGWMPTDPRASVGQCGSNNPWGDTYRGWQLGTGNNLGQIPASATQDIGWPPQQIINAGDVGGLPSYTPTGAVPTLPVPTFNSSSSVNVGNGWFNPSDTAGAQVPIQTCHYLDPWVGDAGPPSPLCGGNRKREPRMRREAAPAPAITPAPSL